ncbi:gamma-glutamylcyclotransferase family protein [Mucilaginibacter aquaedulcis]|uniref:gamma-glutamylcyclotransferase family protein n=1 Tax=Mucilaginibacter aquaedulcis TaxID=1187081 RepID=UPI0025B33693|nr:gamma-glutamylcyclotransferase family protein [Mucilaginibacter aquaedulcis]MDN3549054.1 gamma-glutamylcyclotransferase family protein [Mucilaginibacter aquaedulcis]
MEQINRHLFVYGTLLNSQNSYGAYLQQHCTFLMEGKFKGKLYDMGEYPGAIAHVHGEQYVHGSIYLMDDPNQILTSIDDYEGFGDDQEQPNLFIRVIKEIETATGPIECWVYVYNLPVEHLTQIKSGKYFK